MNHQGHARIKAVFLQAAGLAPDDRPSFIEKACGGDEGLRKEVESLLAHDDSKTIIAGDGGVAPPKSAKAPTAPALGTMLGQYELQEQIGEGGMAQVFRARHVMLNRPTAIKLVKPEQATPSVLARFEREVQIASRLTHPNTIEIYDFGRTPDGVFYCAMELVAGLTLAQLVAVGGAAPPARTVHVLRQVCGSLREAHGLGLVHRDVKPQNIMLGERGGDADVVKVLDFGLVRSIHAEDWGVDAGRAVLAGTPLYMAPERLLDPLSTDPRSDIYSLGAVGFKLLTAKDLFPGDDAADVLDHVLNTAAPRPADAAPHAVPTGLDRLIVTCLAKECADRPPTIDDVLAVLDGLATADPWEQSEARRWWREIAKGAAAVNLLAGIESR